MDRVGNRLEIKKNKMEQSSFSFLSAFLEETKKANGEKGTSFHG